MGMLFSRVWNSLFRMDPVSILMVGLDNAGKTTVLFKLRLGEVVCTIPTIGFNVETVSYKNLNFTVWDVGGQERLRPLWHHYFHSAKAVIYVVDSNDPQRMAEAQEELYRLVTADELRDAPFLILANKQDLPHALSAGEIAKGLGLSDLRSHRWHIQSCCATSGDGLYEGLDWLARDLTNKRN
ncbi:uncharacterized protein LOC129589407 [Paramacrobiotus metropolitanus]|uniref:uncharacterized protein LOC129589407 n=1 Tax=Paramacrobiotus metropolitanus TaxID=2943436 RepID=UPI00244598DE|nr:uncharacterized protein LOC129589407 [Paramacrobiotus metropolitanus]